MTPKQEQEIKKHGKNLKTFFSLPKNTDPITLYKRLRRLEVKATRLVLDWCNGDFKGTVDDYEVAADRIYDAVMLILSPSGKKSIEREEIFFNSDPRGYQLKISNKYSDRLRAAGLHRDWGGYGILAPEF